MRYLLAVVFASALVVSNGSTAGFSLGALAHANSKRTERHLRQGEAAFQDQDYEKAIRRLSRVVDDDDATSAQRGRALELIALSRFILGEREQAAEWFLQLVVHDPSYELTDDFGSEDIRALFERIKNEFLEDNAPVKLVHVPPPAVRGGKKVLLEVRADMGAEEVKGAVLFWRQQGEDTFHEATMTPAGDGAWRARLEAPSSRADYQLEYYMESRDIGDRPNGRLGSPEQPQALDVRAGATKPWYRKWYVIAGGVVIVGLTTTMIVAASQ